MRWIKNVAGPVFLLLLPVLAAPAEAQKPEREWMLSPHGNAILFDDVSALEDGFSGGLHGLYFVKRWLAVGPTLAFGRTQTDGSFFAPFQQNLQSDTSRVFFVGQDLSLLTFGGRAEVHVPVGPFSFFGAGGGGIYSFFLDPEQNRGARFFTNPMLSFGGGVDIEISRRAGFRLEAGDMIFTDYDRDRFDLVDEDFESRLFALPDVPPNESTIHNISLTLGVSFVP